MLVLQHTHIISVIQVGICSSNGILNGAQPKNSIANSVLFHIVVSLWVDDALEYYTGWLSELSGYLVMWYYTNLLPA